MTARLAARIGIGIAVLVLGSAAIVAKKDDKKTPAQIIKLWVDGPARYLMTSREYEDVRSLKTVPELARFITGFWGRRDPTRGTFENEYRRMYWERVIQANVRFRDSTLPGWKTDRGKIFILLGEPNYVESEASPAVAMGPNRRPGQMDPEAEQGHRGIERWHYRRSLSRKANPEFMVAFVRDESFDWKLSSDPDMLRPSFPGIATDDPNDASFAGLENRTLDRAEQQQVAVPGATEGAPPEVVALTPPAEFEPFAEFDASIFANYDLGLELSVPSATELMIATVSTREFLSAFAATPRFEFFRAQDGSTFVNVGALVRPKDVYGDRARGVSGLRLYASLTGVEEPGMSRYVTNEKSPTTYDVGREPPPGGAVDLWTGLALPPGRYLANVAIEDTLTGSLGRASAEIVVPSFPPGQLSLSSLVLASSVSDSGGRLGVTSRASSTFRRSEEFGVYYEVYGVQETHGSPRFDASYRFYRDTEQGPAPIGRPIALKDREQGAQAWSFPLAKWPEGKYGLEVTVTEPGGKSVSAETPFEVID